MPLTWLSLRLCDAAMCGSAPVPVPTAHAFQPLGTPSAPHIGPLTWLSPPPGMLFSSIFASSCHSGLSSKVTFSKRSALPVPVKETFICHPLMCRHPIAFLRGCVGFLGPVALLVYCFLSVDGNYESEGHAWFVSPAYPQPRSATGLAGAR